MIYDYDSYEIDEDDNEEIDCDKCIFTDKEVNDEPCCECGALSDDYPNLMQCYYKEKVVSE